MSKTLLVMGLIAFAGWHGYQNGIFEPDQDLINQRAANASSQAAKSVDQSDALWRYESGLCTPLVSVAPDQSGMSANYVLVQPRTMPPDGSPAVDHYGQLYPDGIFLCTEDGVTAEVVGGKIANIKAAGKSPETVKAIEDWFAMNTRRR